MKKEVYLKCLRSWYKQDETDISGHPSDGISVLGLGEKKRCRQFTHFYKLLNNSRKENGWRRL